jgi:hypothetical protein
MNKLFIILTLVALFFSGCSIGKTGEVLRYVPEEEVTEKIIMEGCVGEGEAVPIKVQGGYGCCTGLKLIPPPSDYYFLIDGVCTNCGNGRCEEAETEHNCPQDCG